MIFIGIDQTGAVDSNGRPKKLPVARVEKNHIEVFKISKLKDLDLKGVKIVAIDSVLGLPFSTFPKNKNIRELFIEATEYQFNKKEYGMETAYQYFQTFLKTNRDHPRRMCEQLANANSVFHKHPFQKNIGCGTYRIWKELGDNPNWFHLWPHDGEFLKLKNKPVILEGYPSLIWRTLLDSPIRQTKNLYQYLKKNKFTICGLNINSDTADAVVLALAAQKFYKNPQKIDFQYAKQEGWIMGLPNSSSNI